MQRLRKDKIYYNIADQVAPQRSIEISLKNVPWYSIHTDIPKKYIIKKDAKLLNLVGDDIRKICSNKPIFVFN